MQECTLAFEDPRHEDAHRFRDRKHDEEKDHDLCDA